jgi:hypothetical protein
MKILFALLVLFQSLAHAQKTPEDILKVYRTDYFETIQKRHELFLLEYNKARLQDYIFLYNLNSEKINSVLKQFNSLTEGWNGLVRTSFDQSVDLPVLASMYVQSQYLKGQLEESVAVMGSMATSIQGACSAETTGWMSERFLPTSMYSIPHYQFSGDGATNNLNLTFQMNYTSTYGTEGTRGSTNSSGGSAQLGDGSKEATAYAAAGMVAGVAIGTAIFPGVGSTVGGYVGLAVGTLVGTVVSTSKQLKEMNAAYDKVRITYKEINVLLRSSHERLDTLHEGLLTSTCDNVFNQNAKTVIPETLVKAQSILSLFNAQTKTINREWDEVKLHNQERFKSHQTFLQLLSEGYDQTFETSIDAIQSEIRFVNHRIKSFYSENVAPALSQSGDDLFEEDQLISLQIQGDAQFGQPDFENYIWTVINEKINSKLGVK